MPVRPAPQMIVMLEIQAPLFENTRYFFYPDLLERFPELRNIWSVIFKDSFDVGIQNNVGASFLTEASVSWSGKRG